MTSKFKFDLSHQILIDQSSLLQLSPIKVVIYGWILYLLTFAIAPITVGPAFSRGAALYIFACYTAFFAGCLVYAPLLKSRNVMPLPSQRGYRILFHCVLAVALIGVMLRVYDRFFVRAASLGQDVLERREALELAGSNAFSVGAAALYPFCFLLPFIYFLRTREERRPYLLWLSILVFCLPGLNAVAVGSRSIILTTVLLLFLYLLYFGFLRLDMRTIIFSLTAALILFMLSTWVFLDRLEAMGMPADVSTYQSAYAITVQPKAWVSESMQLANNHQLLSEAYFTYLNSCQYVLHGLFEFSYLYENFGGPHTMGADMFSIYYKLAALSFNLPNFDERVLDAEPNSGVFTTFFGPLYIDFGWFGPVVVFVLGLCAQKLWTSTKRGQFNLLPLYFYAVIVIFLSPVVNMIANAEGLLVTSACILYYYFSSLIVFPRKDQVG